MSTQNVTIRLTEAGYRTNLFDIYAHTIDGSPVLVASSIHKEDLISGYTVVIDSSFTDIILQSLGKCSTVIDIPIVTMTVIQLAALTFTETNTASMWQHLNDTTVYNEYYNDTEAYVIEYPFAFQNQDEILQNIKDFTIATQYLPIDDGVFNESSNIEVNAFFNKAILYNGQQSTGILNLVPKPLNNLNQYMKYPLYNGDSKTIIYTKSDNFYQYNTFWSLVKDKTQPLFTTSCDSLSVDKVVNQSNMDYGKRSFKKEPLRAKYLKVRHILDNRTDVHLTSGFIIAPSQISYK